VDALLFDRRASCVVSMHDIPQGLRTLFGAQSVWTWGLFDALLVRSFSTQSRLPSLLGKRMATAPRRSKEIKLCNKLGFCPMKFIPDVGHERNYFAADNVAFC